MKNIGIFYGSSIGNTKAVAKTLSQALDADIYDVADASADDLSQYKSLIFGSSTWGFGDLQDDWDGFISAVRATDLSGKKVALFGFGDSDSYPDSFVDAIGTIYKVVKAKGGEVVGATATDTYDYDASEAEVDGQFVGLPLDDENQSDLTDERVNKWIGLLKEKL